MFWVLVFASIAVLGLAVAVSYVIWLAHKASDVWSEVSVVMQRLGQLGDLLGQIRVPALDGEEAMDASADFRERSRVGRGGRSEVADGSESAVST